MAITSDRCIIVVHLRLAVASVCVELFANRVLLSNLYLLQQLSLKYSQSKDMDKLTCTRSLLLLGLHSLSDTAGSGWVGGTLIQWLTTTHIHLLPTHLALRLLVTLLSLPPPQRCLFPFSTVVVAGTDQGHQCTVNTLRGTHTPLQARCDRHMHSEN